MTLMHLWSVPAFAMVTKEGDEISAVPALYHKPKFRGTSPTSDLHSSEGGSSMLNNPRGREASINNCLRLS